MTGSRMRRPSRYNSRNGMAFGLVLYTLEAIQSIALIPFFRTILGAEEATYWIAVTASFNLVSLASICYYQPLIRNVAAASPDHEHPAVPANWAQVLHRAAWFGKGVLLISQLVFLVLALGPRTLGEHGAWPALLFFVSMQFRLASFDHFALLNGLRQVGRDKLMLTVASGTNLLLVIALGLVFRSALALACASLVANVCLFLLARHAARRAITAETAPGIRVHGPPQREMFGLLMLGLAGFLNISTDIVISARLLTPDETLGYAFWSRLLLTQVALAGLAAQVRFPFWASPSRSFASILGEIRRAYGVLLGTSVLLVSVYLVNRVGQWWHHGTLIPMWMIIVMAGSAYLSSMTLLLGQALTVRNAYAFVRPTIIISCIAPPAAVALGRALSPQSFVVAYFFVNLALYAALLQCSRNHRREQAHSSC